jgi:hypothetical protein
MGNFFNLSELLGGSGDECWKKLKVGWWDAHGSLADLEKPYVNFELGGNAELKPSDSIC